MQDTIIPRFDSGNGRMQDNTRIGIAIPVYNEARCIEKTLTSIYRQTDAHGNRMDPTFYEIVIADNAGTDNTVELIKAFAEHHPELTIVVADEPDRGVALARKTAMDLASQRSRQRDERLTNHSPYYLFSLDADCELDPCWLYELHRGMEQADAALGVCHYYYQPSHFTTRPRLWQLIDHIINARTAAWPPLGGGFPDGKGFGVRRESYEKIGGVEIFYQLQDGEFVCHLSDDWDFGIKIRAAGESAIFCPKSKVEINPRRVNNALEDTIYGKAYGDNGIIIMKNIRPLDVDGAGADGSIRDITEQEAAIMWQHSINDFTPKNIILPILLDPEMLTRRSAANFFGEFAEPLYQRILAIKNEMRIIDFMPIHAYKTPSYRLYLEFINELFQVMRDQIGPHMGFPPALPSPLQKIAETRSRKQLERFIYYYCEDRESGEAHNWFGNGGVI